jgi:hypothetical protein
VCVCSLSYSAFHSHAPYYFVICGLTGCATLSTLSHIWHNFRKKSLNTKCVFRFSLRFLSETFLILRRIQRDIIKTHLPSCKAPLCLSDFYGTWISSAGFGEYCNIKFHQNPSSGSRRVPCGRPDGRIEKMKLIVTFCNFVNVAEQHLRQFTEK